MQHTQHKGLARRVSNDMDLAGRAMLGPLTFFVIITALVLTIASCGDREKEGAVVSDETQI